VQSAVSKSHATTVAAVGSTAKDPMEFHTELLVTVLARWLVLRWHLTRRQAVNLKYASIAHVITSVRYAMAANDVSTIATVKASS